MRKVFCFPFAGAGASIYRPWVQMLADDSIVVPVQLPGREQLFAEPPFQDVHQAISQLAPQLMPAVAETSEIVIFGHSLGAILAYEFARTLPADKPAVLIVSGSPAPSRSRAQRATGLDDAQFLARVRDFAGYSHPALEDPDMRELLLPTLRADVQMHETYRPVSTELLDMPIIAIRGNRDELVSRDDMTAWGDVTQSSFEYIEQDGGHMYLTESPESLMGAIRRACAQISAGTQYAA